MQLIVTTLSDRINVVVTGNISWREKNEFREKLYDISHNLLPWIILDLSGVPYVDSSIVSILVHFHGLIQSRQVKMSIIAVDTVFQILYDTNLDQIYQIVENESSLHPKK
ncbi:MAG: STAS domain-containing protein [Candidatus Pacearchaeota archaeon]|nr:STAS domain-containing protein [Candidatus Pacearchaeota archaeon]